MTKVPMLALACGVASAALALAPWASAPGKTPPIQKKEAAKQSFDDLLKSHQQGNGSYRFVSGDETLTSGDAVSITRKGADKRVTGTFVYSDSKTGKLYIRPRAGERPVGIPAGDVDKIERVTPAVGTPEKGGIRPAIEQGEKPAQRYEIHTMTVQNGPYRTTFFYDMSLSGAERDQLSAMEKAGNDIVQKGTTIESLRTAMQNAATDTGTSVVQTAAPAYGQYIPAYPYYYPVEYYNLYYYLYYPMVPFAPYGATFPGYGYGYGGGGGNTTVVIRDSGSNAQSIAALTKSLNEAQTALADAQKNYLAATQRAVYDPNGRIVAVRLEE